MRARPKILVISSDRVIIRFLQDNLNSADYEVVSTQQTREGLRAVMERDMPQLVIVDIMMPNMDGIETSLRIRQWSQVPIMMLSAWGAGQDMIRGLDLSADGYLTEPFGIAELIARIRETFSINARAGSTLPGRYSTISSEN